MRLIQYDFSKIDKTKYSFSEGIIQLIKSGFKNLKEKNYDSAIRDCRNGKEICEKLKVESIKEKDEYSANLSFLFEVYYELIIAISDFWKLCDHADYQDAWSFLQDALGTVSTLNRFVEDESQLSIDKISKYLSQIEKLYPYVNFCSIAYITKKMTCSICKRSPYDSECNHITGDLYWGEMAYNVVEEIEPNHVAITKNPMDKSCVIPMGGFWFTPFPVPFFIYFWDISRCFRGFFKILMDMDKNKLETGLFKIIHFFIQKSKFPLRDFDLLLTKRKLPRTFYNSWSEESLCPCGSEKKFKECCFNKEFILNPHYNVIFKEPIPLKF